MVAPPTHSLGEGSTNALRDRQSRYLGAFFVLVTFVPNKGLAFFLIGVFSFFGFIIPFNLALDIAKPVMALVCGLLVTVAQMLAGASEAVLNIFYVQSKLSRCEIFGTKAITQTLRHIIKLGYHGTLMFITGEFTEKELPFCGSFQQ
jgi:hypothetical protein